MLGSDSQRLLRLSKQLELESNLLKAQDRNFAFLHDFTELITIIQENQ